MRLTQYQSLFNLDYCLDGVRASTNHLSAALLSPKIEIYEQDECYMVCAEFPGVKQEDIVASFDNGVLTLTVPKASEKDVEAKRIPIK